MALSRSRRRGASRSRRRPRASRKSRPSRRSRAASRRRPTKQRKSLTRGWKKASPKRGSQRHALHKRCGAKCFLDPANEKFPICAKLTGRSSQCKIDCRGVKSAYIRARQWGYDDIAEKADRLYRRHCE